MMKRQIAITTAIAGLALGMATLGYGALTDGAHAQGRNDMEPAPPAPSSDAMPPITMPSTVIDVQEDDDTVMPGNASSNPAGTMDNAVTARVEAKDLIGAELRSAEDETVGEVESIYLNQEGEVRSVIVGVGGLFGFGERKVALGWNALNVADDGLTVHTTLTKDQLKQMPEYRYADNSYRGKLFNDSGIVTN